MPEALPIDTNLANADLIPRQAGPPMELFAEWRRKDPVHWNPPPEDYRPAASINGNSAPTAARK